jgi:hypothetical protein
MKKDRSLILIVISILIIFISIKLINSCNNNPQASIKNKTQFIPLTSIQKKDFITFSDPEINITFKYPKEFLDYTDFHYLPENKLLKDEEKLEEEFHQKYPEAKRLKPSYYWPFFDFDTNYGNLTSIFNQEMNQEILSYEQVCKSQIFVKMRAFYNPNNSSLYDVIEETNDYEIYFSGGPTAFDFIQDNLISSNWPKTNSYIFKVVMGETNYKEVWFDYHNNVFLFSLTGGCDTGGVYSSDAEQLFDEIINTIEFL